MQRDSGVTISEQVRALLALRLVPHVRHSRSGVWRLVVLLLPAGVLVGLAYGPAAGV